MWRDLLWWEFYSRKQIGSSLKVLMAEVLDCLPIFSPLVARIKPPMVDTTV